jgi:hypothetical protein
VSNVPSNITMTVIAALINAGPAASRRHVTPPGFNAILSGVPAPPPSVLLHVRVYCEGMIRAIDRARTIRARRPGRPTLKIALDVGVVGYHSPSLSRNYRFASGRAKMRRKRRIHGDQSDCSRVASGRVSGELAFAREAMKSIKRS